MVFIPATEFHSQLEALMALLVGIPPLVFTEVRLRCWEQAGRAREERRRQHQKEMERSNREKVRDLRFRSALVMQVTGG